MSNKANIERQKVDRYIISSNQVTSYLQRQLGFPIIADYTRWTGVTANHSYVRMRVGMANKDIVAAQAQPTSYVERVLQENVADTEFKSNVKNVLTPFMYPESLAAILQDADKVNDMYKYGIHYDHLEEIAKYTRLAYVQDQKMWRVYLRPEKIITDMLSEEDTGKVNGTLAITGVFGTDSNTIRWEVEITRDNMSSNTELGIVNLDKLFAYN